MKFLKRRNGKLSAIMLMTLLIPLFSFSKVYADNLITMPGIFSNNMMLQRETKVKVWGKGGLEGEQVKVQIAGQDKTAIISNGNWSLELDPISAGGPYQMIVTGAHNTITITNILVGEVWLASGQSNMAYGCSKFIADASDPTYVAPYGIDTAAQLARLKDDLANSADSKLRLFTVGKVSSTTPSDVVTGSWSLADPTSVGKFSAVAYYFARELKYKLDPNGNIPVGIVASAVVGTTIERWVSQDVMSDPYYDTDIFKDGTECNLYNGMIYPLRSFGFKGVIWYQGEGNAKYPDIYAKLFPALINSWRTEFQQNKMPFLFVNLAPYGSDYTFLREAQLKTLVTVPNTEMAIITDAGDPTDIHPKDKKPVGERLAQAALAKVYGKNIEYSGPVYKNMKVSGNKIILSFNHIGTGLMPMTGDTELRGFQISSDGSTFVTATAQIVGDTVEVSASRAPSPIAVRYGWNVDNKSATQIPANLYNAEGFPAVPFRASNPVFTINSVKFYDSNNIEITNNTLPSSGDLKVNINYNNKGILSSKLLIATYDNEKKLVNCDYFTPTFDYTNSITLEKNINISAIRNGGKVKIIAWDDMAGLQPIANTTNFPNN